MRFYTVHSFDQHLQHAAKESFSEDKSPLFLILSEDLSERVMIREKVLKMLSYRYEKAQLIFLDLCEDSYSSIKRELESGDLFSKERILVLKSFEKASKSLLESLSEELKERRMIPILVEGKEEKGEGSFYSKLKKDLVVMDLTKEKVWDKKARILQWAQAFAHRHKKSIGQDVLEVLYERCEKSFSQLMQEMEKLVCFSKNISTIQLGHLQEICGLQPEMTAWAICEKLVWEELTPQVLAKIVNRFIESSDYALLLGQLRYHYHLALKIKDMEGFSEEEMKKEVSSLHPKTMQKYRQASRQMSKAFLTRALSLLFDEELQFKSQGLDPNIAWVRLLGKIHALPS